MKTSVVLTTYNGEKYIIQLLDSLNKQSRKIDEVLIVDDCSNDKTQELVKKYINENKLDNWKFIINKCNLGWELNFTTALNMSTGDIIFPADQDDIWHFDKIERMAAEFEKNENIWVMVSSFCAFSNEGKCNEILHRVPTKNNMKNGFVEFNNKYYQILRPGCTMAVKRDVLPIFVKLWEPGTPHDALLWTLAAITRKLYLYDEVLIDYRRHKDNASKDISHGVKYKINEIARTKKINNWYKESLYVNSKDLKVVNEIDIWCNYREELLVNKKFRYWFKLIKYRNCYLTNKKFLGDIYYFFK